MRGYSFTGKSVCFSNPRKAYKFFAADSKSDATICFKSVFEKTDFLELYAFCMLCNPEKHTITHPHKKANKRKTKKGNVEQTRMDKGRNACFC